MTRHLLAMFLSRNYRQLLNANDLLAKRDPSLIADLSFALALEGLRARLIPAQANVAERLAIWRAEPDRFAAFCSGVPLSQLSVALREHGLDVMADRVAAMDAALGQRDACVKCGKQHPVNEPNYCYNCGHHFVW